MFQLTYSPKAKEIKRTWHLVDYTDQLLGRTATKIASFLIGKGKPYFTPHLDCGDYVVVVNAEKVKVSGKKSTQKIYYRHSGYPGGFKQIPYARQMEKDPRKVIELAVKGMLPKNKLRAVRLRRLKVFVGDKHPYQEKMNKEGK
ncbi:MAG: 50S ribosomal protein L13 [Candidatus Chisholmbacteria bacterium RIFCSPHIGHO2_01_FULL_49_18]|uniref:Large ribosomal subunit protein uL13 n=2 Tax=Candidatus Chisholmiibacteriota TaxID=1817900 RepID=A0A1G1VM09_9BACT|nr:MAG: 50S ribosomal protein L13 [Candidatus Chisholmbacteria bacterium RIFCSPHIGHO2_01_FULL_49_18]OGY19396.1 MAG: 50S ribosomal protein L13 [Candidatus Chisholmbacteria bacterium RIFCSPLOWO2_01_FULL_49_14]